MLVVLLPSSIPAKLETSVYCGGVTRLAPWETRRTTPQELAAPVTLVTMRLIAWNCCEKLATNYVHPQDLISMSPSSQSAFHYGSMLYSPGLTPSFVQPVAGSSKHLGDSRKRLGESSPTPSCRGLHGSFPWSRPDPSPSRLWGSGASSPSGSVRTPRNCAMSSTTF